VFVPELEGKREQPIEFSNVLHVPDLHSNLLPVLYLTRNKLFSVIILETVMSFIHSKAILFTAQVNSLNCAYLEGITSSSASPIINSALTSSTLPMDASLWHRRLCHHHYRGIECIMSQQLISGLGNSLKLTPDPICEPCLSGKMHTNPFPHSESQTSCPLELVHSDLHGPLPVRTHSGYHYWVSFIDHYT